MNPVCAVEPIDCHLSFINLLSHVLFSGSETDRALRREHRKALDLLHGLLTYTLTEQDHAQGSPSEEEDAERAGDEPV